jgi:glutathione peroxidase
MRIGIAVLASLAVFVSACGTNAGDDKSASNALNFTMKSIDGKDVPLSTYQGKVILMVNVASKCGLTPQYKELQALYEKYKDQGFVVIGVPANEFRGQEPGTNEEIAQFCSTNYGVTFPMMAKVVVKGNGICPLYKYLTAQKTKPTGPGEITWNFEKFIINREGKVVGRFSPKVKPDNAEVVKLIETELAKK